MPENKDWRDRRAQYSMYAMFSTNERAEKRRKAHAADQSNVSHPPVQQSSRRSAHPVSSQQKKVPTPVSARYTVQRTRRKLHRPLSESNASSRAKDRNEAMFLAQTGSGRKVLIHNTSLSEMHAVRVPPVVHIKTYKTKHAPALTFSNILTIFSATVLVTGLIVSYINLSDETAALSALDAEYDSVQEQLMDLDRQVRKRYDLIEIEKTAQQLGMVSIDQAERIYVPLEGYDHAKVITKENEEKEDENVKTDVVILE